MNLGRFSQLTQLDARALARAAGARARARRGPGARRAGAGSPALRPRRHPGRRRILAARHRPSVSLRPDAPGLEPRGPRARRLAVRARVRPARLDRHPRRFDRRSRSRVPRTRAATRVVRRVFRRAARPDGGGALRLVVAQAAMPSRRWWRSCSRSSSAGSTSMGALPFTASTLAIAGDPRGAHLRRDRGRRGGRSGCCGGGVAAVPSL